MDVTNEVLALIGTKLQDESTTIAQALQQLGTREQLDDRVAVEVPSLGISVETDLQGVVRAVHAFGKGTQGYSPFPLTLQGVNMGSDQEHVRQRLGVPMSHGPGSTSRYLAGSGPWDVYRVGDARVHIEYATDATEIKLVTITKWR